MPQLTDEHTVLIGKESPPRPAPYAINEAMARFWCEMVEDPNPIYFDEEYAAKTWLKEPFAPPAMLFTWGMQPVWPEGDRHESMISRLQFSGCTATLAVNATQEYFLPLHYGDHLTITNQIASIGEEKTTRLGSGHFVTTLDTFRNQNNAVAGTHSFTLFMYVPGEEGGGKKKEGSREGPGARSQEREEAPAGDKLAPISLPLTLRRTAQAVAGTRDYYPFHHDEKFARDNGAEGIFFNTMFLQAFAGRCATEWFGNDAFLRRLEIAMRGSNYVGRTLTCEAAVTSVQQADRHRLVDVEGMLSTEDGPTTGVKWVVEVQA
jgi:acyl dehydratase